MEVVETASPRGQIVKKKQKQKQYSMSRRMVEINAIFKSCRIGDTVFSFDPLV